MEIQGQAGLVRLLCRRLRKGRALKWACLVLGLLMLCVLGGGVFEWQVRQPFDTAPYFSAPASGTILDRNGQLLFVALNAEEHWRMPVALGQVSPHLIHATVAAEDQRFWRHPGVDPLAVLRAAVQQVQPGGRRSGASTLTMQLVKLSRPKQHRGLRGKISQAWLALRLERHASKEAILAAYLNAAPYGANVQGAEAASRRYFGKPAMELTIAEAALLAGLPKAPTALFPVQHPERAGARRA